ncbi:hypothetical protein DM860_016121 [Cuscuta australis]|uniref:Uncharacterized protein n=1 Tax=Cuscuta australis TaxID=267555 RepID=A0A328E2M9_9ASTE|nr:hypothetical protein DM860_016121 [Cuscuta australis]
MSLAVHCSYLPPKFQLARRIIPGIRPNPPQLFIATNLDGVDIHCVGELYSACNHSCHRFHKLDADGRVDPVDPNKLRKAILHSSVVAPVWRLLEEIWLGR